MVSINPVKQKISIEAKEGRTCIQINIKIFQLKTSCISVNVPVPFTKNFYNLNITDLQRRKSFVKYCNLPLYISWDKILHLICNPPLVDN